MPIMTVALDRFATGFPNRVLEGGDGLLLRCRRASHVENLFLHNSAV